MDNTFVAKLELQGVQNSVAQVRRLGDAFHDLRQNLADIDFRRFAAGAAGLAILGGVFVALKRSLQGAAEDARELVFYTQAFGKAMGAVQYGRIEDLSVAFAGLFPSEEFLRGSRALIAGGARGNLVELAQIAADMAAGRGEGAFERVTQALSRMMQTDNFSLQAFSRLMRLGIPIREIAPGGFANIDDFIRKWKASPYAGQGQRVVNADPSMQFASAAAAIREAGETTAAILLPAMRDFALMLKTVADWFRSINDAGRGFPGLVLAIIAITAAVNLLRLAFIASNVVVWKTILLRIIETAANVALAASLFLVDLGLAPMLALLLAIVAVIAVLTGLFIGLAKLFKYLFGLGQEALVGGMEKTQQEIMKNTGETAKNTREMKQAGAFGRTGPRVQYAAREWALRAALGDLMAENLKSGVF